ncbi:MAG: hypothetical protein Q4A19_03505 [Johnsonella sp.]|nr:hypothetical protein [Johnsonella sp.]
MGGIANLLNKHFSKDTIRAFSIEGKADDISYQISHGLKKEMRMKIGGRESIVGYELTEKGKKQIETDNREMESLSFLEKDYVLGISAFCKEEREYWRRHPKYSKEEEYKRMSEDEEFAYKHLQRIADTSFF